jgi:PAS domain S-box-containing protein
MISLLPCSHRQAHFSLGLRLPSYKRSLVIVFLICAGYYLGGILGIRARLSSTGSSALWPPNAILLAALLLTPVREWWIYLLATLATHLHLTSNFQGNVPLLVMLCQVVGNSFQVVIAALAVRRFTIPLPRFDNIFGNLKGTSAFVFLAAIVAPAAASAVAAYLFTATGWVEHFWRAWGTRFFSNVVATLTITPLILWAFTSKFARARQLAVRLCVEFALLMAGLFAIGILIFGLEATVAGNYPALLYVPLPLLLWAAVRFGPAGLVPSLLIIAALCLLNAFAGRGPFAAQSPAENVLSLQIFLIAMFVPLMLLAALIEERRDNENALRESEERRARTEKFSLVMVTHLDLEGRWLKVPPTLCELLGYRESELLGHRFHEVTHPDDVEADWRQCLRLIRGEIKSFDLEKRYIRKGRGIVWVYLNCSVVTNGEGAPVQLLTYIRDITERKLYEEKLRQYQESLRQLANELNTTEARERKRFAADLHDQIGQSLVLAKLELGQLGELANALDENALSSIERLEEIIDQALNEIRSLTQDLSPQVLYTLGFDSALEWLADNMQERYDLACRIEVGKQPTPLSGDPAVVAFQAVRELLINVVKHAGVKKASVSITREETAVVIHVEDRGRGFIPDALDLQRCHGGFGLFSIRERLSLLGGDLEIKSSPGNGTSAQVVIPVAATDPAGAFPNLAS